jgi:hypothetical protein
MATTSGLPYSIRIPEDGDLADVPADFAKVAADVTTALNNKLARANLSVPGEPQPRLGADALYQSKIKIVTEVPTSAAGYFEGDIIFVVPT